MAGNTKYGSSLCGGEGTYVSLLLNTLNISFDLVDNIYLKVVSLEMSIGSLK